MTSVNSTNSNFINPPDKGKNKIPPPPLPPADSIENKKIKKVANFNPSSASTSTSNPSFPDTSKFPSSSPESDLEETPSTSKRNIQTDPVDYPTQIDPVDYPTQIVELFKAAHLSSERSEEFDNFWSALKQEKSNILIDVVDKEGCSLFLKAIEEGNLFLSEHFLDLVNDKPFWLDRAYPTGNPKCPFLTPLQTAVISKNLEMVVYLIRRGANTKYCDTKQSAAEGLKSPPELANNLFLKLSISQSKKRSDYEEISKNNPETKDQDLSKAKREYETAKRELEVIENIQQALIVRPDVLFEEGLKKYLEAKENKKYLEAKENEDLIKALTHLEQINKNKNPIKALTHLEQINKNKNPIKALTHLVTLTHQWQIKKNKNHSKELKHLEQIKKALEMGFDPITEYSYRGQTAKFSAFLIKLMTNPDLVEILDLCLEKMFVNTIKKEDFDLPDDFQPYKKYLLSYEDAKKLFRAEELSKGIPENEIVDDDIKIKQRMERENRRRSNLHIEFSMPFDKTQLIKINPLNKEVIFKPQYTQNEQIRNTIEPDDSVLPLQIAFASRNIGLINKLLVYGADPLFKPENSIDNPLDWIIKKIRVEPPAQNRELILKLHEIIQLTRSAELTQSIPHLDPHTGEIVTPITVNNFNDKIEKYILSLKRGEEDKELLKLLTQFLDTGFDPINYYFKNKFGDYSLMVEHLCRTRNDQATDLLKKILNVHFFTPPSEKNILDEPIELVFSDLSDKYRKVPLLCIAIERLNWQAVQTLLEFGADPENSKIPGLTPLSYLEKIKEEAKRNKKEDHEEAIPRIEQDLKAAIEKKNSKNKKDNKSAKRISTGINEPQKLQGSPTVVLAMASKTAEDKFLDAFNNLIKSIENDCYPDIQKYYSEINKLLNAGFDPIQKFHNANQRFFIDLVKNPISTVLNLFIEKYKKNSNEKTVAPLLETFKDTEILQGEPISLLHVAIYAENVKSLKILLANDLDQKNSAYTISPLEYATGLLLSLAESDLQKKRKLSHIISILENAAKKDSNPENLEEIQDLFMHSSEGPLDNSVKLENEVKIKEKLKHWIDEGFNPFEIFLPNNKNVFLMLLKLENKEIIEELVNYLKEKNPEKDVLNQPYEIEKDSNKWFLPLIEVIPDDIQTADLLLKLGADPDMVDKELSLTSAREQAKTNLDMYIRYPSNSDNLDKAQKFVDLIQKYAPVISIKEIDWRSDSEVVALVQRATKIDEFTPYFDYCKNNRIDPFDVSGPSGALLSKAALYSPPDVFAKLVERADKKWLNFVEPDGTSPLYNSIICGSLEKVKILIEAGANPNIKFEYFGMLIVTLYSDNGNFTINNSPQITPQKQEIAQYIFNKIKENRGALPSEPTAKDKWWLAHGFDAWLEMYILKLMNVKTASKEVKEKTKEQEENEKKAFKCALQAIDSFNRNHRNQKIDSEFMKDIDYNSLEQLCDWGGAISIATYFGTEEFLTNFLMQFDNERVKVRLSINKASQKETLPIFIAINKQSEKRIEILRKYGADLKNSKTKFSNLTAYDFASTFPNSSILLNLKK